MSHVPGEYFQLLATVHSGVERSSPHSIAALHRGPSLRAADSSK